MKLFNRTKKAGCPKCGERTLLHDGHCLSCAAAGRSMEWKVVAGPGGALSIVEGDDVPIAHVVAGKRSAAELRLTAAVLAGAPAYLGVMTLLLKTFGNSRTDDGGRLALRVAADLLDQLKAAVRG